MQKYSKPHNDNWKKKEMFDAVCSNCGNRCQVPFRPSADKPVLCDSCFSKKRENSSREYKDSIKTQRSDRRDEYQAPDRAQINVARPDQKINELKMQVIAMNEKIESLLDVTKNLTAKIASMEVTKNVMTKNEEVKKVAKKTVKKTTKKIGAKK